MEIEGRAEISKTVDKDTQEMPQMGRSSSATLFDTSSSTPRAGVVESDQRIETLSRPGEVEKSIELVETVEESSDRTLTSDIEVIPESDSEVPLEIPTISQSKTKKVGFALAPYSPLSNSNSNSDTNSNKPTSSPISRSRLKRRRSPSLSHSQEEASLKVKKGKGKEKEKEKVYGFTGRGSSEEGSEEGELEWPRPSQRVKEEEIYWTDEEEEVEREQDERLEEAERKLEESVV